METTDAKSRRKIPNPHDDTFDEIFVFDSIEDLKSALAAEAERLGMTMDRLLMPDQMAKSQIVYSAVAAFSDERFAKEPTGGKSS